MNVLSTRSPDPWKATGGTGRRSGRPRRRIEPADTIEIIDRSLVDAVARQFPDMWEDLSNDGRDMFVRGLLEAASRAMDDRVKAVAEVIDSWQTAWSLLYAPVDDEPLTPEEGGSRRCRPGQRAPGQRSPDQRGRSEHQTWITWSRSER